MCRLFFFSFFFFFFFFSLSCVGGEMAARKAVALDPGALAYQTAAVRLGRGPPDARLELAKQFLKLGRLQDAEQILETMEEIATARGLLGLVRRDLGASDFGSVYHHLVDSVRMQRSYLASDTNVTALEALRDLMTLEPRSEEPMGLGTYVHRLRHDVEHARYLEGEGLVESSLANAVEMAYAPVIKEWGDADVGDEQLILLARKQWGQVFRFFGRALDVPQHAHSDFAGRLLADQDWDALERQYWASSPNILVIDGLLRPEALERVFRSVMQTPFFGTRQSFVASWLTDALWSPLMDQLEAELRRRLPSIFCPAHRLTNAWAFRYDDKVKMGGIRPHCDPAAVNFNFWLSPDEANLDPKCGGLDIYPIEPPPGWDEEQFNNHFEQASLQRLIRDQTPIAVPFRRNRAVVFQSELVHASQDMHWETRGNFTLRRVNLTFLFGDAGESQICRAAKE